jgi:hypothetical protein
VLGDEIGVGEQAVACAFYLDDDSVVEEPVQQRGGNDGVAEHLSPFGEAAVGGEDHGGLLVAGIDELEEEIGAAGRDWQVADFVDDEQAAAAEEADLLDQAALALGTAKRLDQLGQGVRPATRAPAALASNSGSVVLGKCMAVLVESCGRLGNPSLKQIVLIGPVAAFRTPMHLPLVKNLG